MQTNNLLTLTKKIPTTTLLYIVMGQIFKQNSIMDFYDYYQTKSST